MTSHGDEEADEETPPQPPASMAAGADDDFDVKSIPHDASTWRRYGADLRQRRRSLGRRYEDAGKASGKQVSSSVLSKLENGHALPVRRTTFDALDDFYGYQRGSIYRLYRYDVAPVPKRRRPAGQQPLAEYPALLPPESIIEAIEADGELRELADATPEDHDLRAIQKRIARSTDRLLRAWVLAQVEGRKADGFDVDLFVKPILAAQLSRDPVTTDDRDLDELLYLRWLLGQAKGLTAEDETRFCDLFTKRTQG
ncbi:MAG: helix-turn-helix domain-containing protein [Mycobacterium sp.]|nr:helix-turn-helix domain-containing protein [Mycobacterium sp.]